MDLKTLTISGARDALARKEYSALELADAHLEEIKRRDGEIHAYLEAWEESARAEAKRADVELAEGHGGPLCGIPLAIKDNILMEGRVASAASKMLESYRATYTATVIEKLISQHAVFLGRTNMDEFAMGSSTEHSAFGPTRNPVDTARVPGGSSGGSAAAVAAYMALGALGSDTGGSIRQPASLTGIVGLKPTYGAVSRFGLIAMGSSLDQIGPLARTVEDARLLFHAIRGHDPRDSTSLSDAPDSSTPSALRVGVPRAFLTSGIEPDVLASFEERLRRLKSVGHTIIDIELPATAASLAAYYVLMPAEASTNLARFDGVRYGFSAEADSIRDMYEKSRGSGFGAEVRRRILIGTFVLSAGYADAYYRKARAVRAAIRRDFERAFETVDAIATPTTPGPAFTLGSKADPLSMYAEDIFAVPANLAGTPALSVPSGTVVRDGTALPVGFQLIGPHRGEETLFSLGAALERAA